MSFEGVEIDDSDRQNNDWARDEVQFSYHISKSEVGFLSKKGCERSGTETNNRLFVRQVLPHRGVRIFGADLFLRS
jgi:hypothetical protein